MVDGIGKQGALAREAVLAALKAQVDKPSSQAGGGLEFPSARIEEARAQAGTPDRVREGLDAVEAELKKAQNLPEDLLAGRIDDFHEIAVQIKRADISFRFAMEIRNKLVDAYREVMRMNV